MFYIVLEVQNAGTPAVLTDVYVDSSQAYAKFYTILSAAAVSSVPYHAAYIVRDDGAMIEGKVFDRRDMQVVID